MAVSAARQSARSAAGRPRSRPGTPAGRPRTDADRRRRELSQNYLRDGQAAAQFLRAVAVDPAGLCLEVGAGEGILSTRLAGMCRELIAYEVDPAHAAKLQSRLRSHGNGRVVIGDFLAARPPHESFQVVGNAPFSLTSPIVDWCLAARRMRSATLITQFEYAKKRTGKYGRWSLLTISTWPFMRWELRGRIARAQFRPMPRVDAGILHLERRARPLIPPARLGSYRRLVEAGFAGLGGSLHASMRRQYPPDRLGEAFGAAALDRRTVVGFVSPDQWITLFHELDRPARGRGALP
jgi:23S rRNA (adenine-N6)-dimethyltransferase